MKNAKTIPFKNEMSLDIIEIFSRFLEKRQNLPNQMKSNKIKLSTKGKSAKIFVKCSIVDHEGKKTQQTKTLKFGENQTDYWPFR